MHRRTDRRRSVARIADCLANPGKTIDFNGRKVTYPDIKLVYVAGGNPFHHHQDTNNLVKAWRKPQTVIVHEPYWTATAKHADIVLPATTSYERNDLEMGGDYSQRYVFPMHQCVPPQFEARNDFDIFRDVAAKLGLQEQYTEGKDEMLWLKQMYDGMAAQARGAGWRCRRSTCSGSQQLHPLPGARGGPPVDPSRRFSREPATQPARYPVR